MCENRESFYALPVRMIAFAVPGSVIDGVFQYFLITPWQKPRHEKRNSDAAKQLKTFRGNAIVENAFLPKSLS